MTIRAAGLAAFDLVVFLLRVIHRGVALGKVAQRLAVVLVGQELAFFRMHDVIAALVRFGLDVVVQAASPVAVREKRAECRPRSGPGILGSSTNLTRFRNCGAGL